MSIAKRILIVDDEPDICEILRFNLEMEGYDVDVAEGADEGQDIIIKNLSVGKHTDLILLDVMMTPKSGFEWAAELKRNYFTSNIPIIFCTAKTLEEDLLHGFALGSDDYICKPFRISEVKARVKAVLRRGGALPDNYGTAHVSSQKGMDMNTSTGSHTNTLTYSPFPSKNGSDKGIVLDIDRKECYVDGKEVAFTKLEFEVLSLLLSKPGQVFSREVILQRVWPDDTIVLDRTVDVNITRIRKKIGRYGECLRTKFGYGYFFNS